MSTKTNARSSSFQHIQQALGKVLADTYVLYVKTQGFHWNIEGPRFLFLHELFQTQYEELAGAIDEIAEQIRIQGAKPPCTMSEFIQLSGIIESSEKLSENDMLKELVADHSLMANTLKPFISAASEVGDEGTADLLVQRLRVHEKTAWMLRSHLSD